MGEPLDLGFHSFGSKQNHEGFDHYTMGINPIGPCESQALGLDFHSRKEPCGPQVFGLGPLCFSKMTEWVRSVGLGF